MNDSTLTRRQALVMAGAATTTAWLRTSVRAADSKNPQHAFLLSEQGCGRASGYAESNKIVTYEGRTHVAWLDSPPEGFRVRIRTLDHRTGQWSQVVTLGEAYDNHGGPALTIDSQGYLHVVYYPHHHAIRYRKSKRPGDVSAWEEEISFGERLTYPTLVCGEDDTLYFTARRRFPDRPWEVELWTKPPGEEWQRERSILASRHPGYAHFQESLAWGSDHRTLHLCCRFHENTDRDAYGRLQTVAYLVSPDSGQTWQTSDGRSVELPVTAESAEVLASGGVDHARILRVGAMSVDPQGRPHVVYSTEEQGRSELLIARPRGDGTWQRIDLTRFLPEMWSSWNLMAPAGVTFTATDEMIVTAQIQQPIEGESSWGNPTNEAVLFRSRDDGQTFTFSLVSSPDPQESHWLPNIERPTGHNIVPARPGILYTSGGPGEKNMDLLSNRVYFTKAVD